MNKNNSGSHQPFASAFAGIAGSCAETGTGTGAGGSGASVGDDSGGLCGTSCCSPDVVPRKAPVCCTTT